MEAAHGSEEQMMIARDNVHPSSETAVDYSLSICKSIFQIVQYIYIYISPRDPSLGGKSRGQDEEQE